MLQSIGDADFDTEIAHATTLVYFWAPWCGPCRALGPMLEALAHGAVSIRKLNTDEHRLAASRYGIRAVPTLLLFKEGRVVAQVVGAVPRAKIEALLAS